METIKGEIEQIIFYSEDDGYAVVKLNTENGEKAVAVGYFGDISPGEIIEAKGTWRQSPKYGLQFQVESYKSVLPSTCEGIRKYLASGLIKGIGPVLAERIVEKFGTETVEILENFPERLLEVEGIGTLKLQNIKKAWAEQKDIRELMEFLQTYDIPTGQAPKIFKHYGKDSIHILKNNPYQIAIDISGIGFLTADKIAKKLGIKKDSPIRIRGAIFYILQKTSAEEGHVCLPKKKLVEIVKNTLGISQDVVEKTLEELIASQEIIDETFKENSFVYLPGFYKIEKSSAEKLMEIFKTKSLLTLRSPSLVESILASVEQKLSINLEEQQRNAVITALTNKVTIITGGPGTGKTTLVKALIMASEIMGIKVVLTAPTGRATKRLEEVTNRKAFTIHRLLEYSPKKEGTFMKNSSNPIKADMVIVDEASMVDIILFYYLLKAIPLYSSLVFVGDVDQLPSVGPGNVLKGLISSEVFPVIKLSKIHRQAQDSHIIINAHRVMEGKMPLNHEKKPPEKADFYFIRKNSQEEILSTIVSLCKERIPSAFGFHPLRDIQVITPMNRGILGTYNLNRVLQDILNPDFQNLQVEKGGKRFRKNDKVMQIKNNYEKNVFNGDIGRVVLIDQENQEIIVDFYGQKVRYDFSELDELVPAYAISIHKSQGSEYPAVVIPIATQHYVMLQRNLIYTAITRGKKLVVLVGMPKALAIGIKNIKIHERFTLFKERLKIL